MGKATIRLVQTAKGYAGVMLANGDRQIFEGNNPDDVWRQLQDAAAHSNPHFFGYDGARKRFLRYFPGGFSDPIYFDGERDYKLKAKLKLEKAAPLEKARHAIRG